MLFVNIAFDALLWVPVCCFVILESELQNESTCPAGICSMISPRLPVR